MSGFSTSFPLESFDKTLAEAIELLLDGTITPELHAHLERRLAEDVTAREQFVDHVRLNAAIRWDFDELWDRETEILPLLTQRPPVLDFLGSAYQGSVTYFSQIGPLSYLVATFLLAMILVIGSVIQVSRPQHQQANNTILQPTTPAGHIAPMQLAARVTGMMDCRWADPKTRVAIGADVPLDKTFALASGLLEITHNSGARVLLQGPCTYRVESKTSGYLALGKLTALVEKKAESGKPRAENTIHSSLSPLPSPLFAIRTPTAIVTDLGTEFGVEVEKSGTTRSHVFQGSVEVRSSNSWKLTTSGERVKILHAGESARIERGRKGAITISRKQGQPGRFVRRILNPKSILPPPASRPSSPTRMSPEAYAQYVLSLNPVAYYRMDRTNLQDNEGRPGVFDSSPGSHHGVFVSKDESFMPYTAGLFGNAMSFRGSSMKDCVLVRGIPDPKDHQLTLAAWVKADAPVDRPLIAHRLGFFRNEENVANGFQFGFPGTVLLHRWHHVAYVVHDQSGKSAVSVYLNGKCLRHEPFSNVWFKLIKGYWSIGGPDSAMRITQKPKWNNWQGQIDEFAMFNKALSPETIERLYLGGTPRKGDGVMKDP